MPRERNVHIAFTGNGNNITSTNPSEDTVTINGQTYPIGPDGTIDVDGNHVSVRNPRTR